MEELILRLLGRQDYAPSNVPQLIQALGLRPGQQQPLQAALRDLEQKGEIIRTKGNRYIQSREADLVPGRIRVNRQGKGFLEPDDSAQKEIVVPESATGTAFNGDRVLVRREVARGSRAGETTGTVVRILERARATIVGTLQSSKQFLFVIPDDPRIPHDIYVPPARDTGRPAQHRRQSGGGIARLGIAPHQSRRRNHRGPRPGRCGRGRYALGAAPLQSPP